MANPREATAEGSFVASTEGSFGAPQKRLKFGRRSRSTHSQADVDSPALPCGEFTVDSAPSAQRTQIALQNRYRFLHTIR